MATFILVTGESGSGKHYYNLAEAERYVIDNERSVYSFPIKGFEIKTAKKIELPRLAHTRKPGMYQVIIENTYDKTEHINKFIPKIKNSLIIIPVCSAYLEVIQDALANRNEKDNDIILVRDTIKDLNKITTIIPDCFRIHSDTTLPIQKVYAAELSAEIGGENALAFLFAQWIVNLQFAENKKAEDEIFKLGYYLYVQNAKIITISDKPDERANLREFILKEGTELIKARFQVEKEDEEIRNYLLTFMD